MTNRMKQAEARKYADLYMEKLAHTSRQSSEHDRLFRVMADMHQQAGMMSTEEADSVIRDFYANGGDTAS